MNRLGTIPIKDRSTLAEAVAKRRKKVIYHNCGAAQKNSPRAVEERDRAAPPGNRAKRAIPAKVDTGTSTSFVSLAAGTNKRDRSFV